MTNPDRPGIALLLVVFLSVLLLVLTCAGLFLWALAKLIGFCC